MIAEPMSQEMRVTARMLAKVSREAEPAIRKTLLFPSTQEVRLVHIDVTAHPSGHDEELAPFYFNPDFANGIPFRSAIALVRPEEEGRLSLPMGWGAWGDAEVIWERN